VEEGGTDFPLSFAYQSKVAPMLWVMIALGTIELLVVHFLISFWSLWVAAILSLLSLASIVWLVLLIRSMKRLPVLVERERLVMRTGSLTEFAVPGANIAAVRTNFPSEAVKERSVLDLGLLAYPNVLVELRRPVERSTGRRTSAVAHCLDDPAAFAAAVKALCERSSRES
jgi:hypothetical protein